MQQSCCKRREVSLCTEMKQVFNKTMESASHVVTFAILYVYNSSNQACNTHVAANVSLLALPRCNEAESRGNFTTHSATVRNMMFPVVNYERPRVNRHEDKLYCLL